MRSASQPHAANHKALLHFLGTGVLEVDREDVGVAIVASTEPDKVHECCEFQNWARLPLKVLLDFVPGQPFAVRFGLKKKAPGSRTLYFKDDTEIYTRRRIQPELGPLRAFFNYLMESGTTRLEAKGKLYQWTTILRENSDDIYSANLRTEFGLLCRRASSNVCAIPNKPNAEFEFLEPDAASRASSAKPVIIRDIEWNKRVFHSGLPEFKMISIEACDVKPCREANKFYRALLRFWGELTKFSLLEVVSKVIDPDNICAYDVVKDSICKGLQPPEHY